MSFAAAAPFEEQGRGVVLKQAFSAVDDGLTKAAQGFGRRLPARDFALDELPEALDREQLACRSASFGESVGVEQDEVTGFKPFLANHRCPARLHAERRRGWEIEGFDQSPVAKQQGRRMTAAHPGQPAGSDLEFRDTAPSIAV